MIEKKPFVAVVNVAQIHVEKKINQCRYLEQNHPNHAFSAKTCKVSLQVIVHECIFRHSYMKQNPNKIPVYALKYFPSIKSPALNIKEAVPYNLPVRPWLGISTSP